MHFFFFLSVERSTGKPVLVRFEVLKRSGTEMNAKTNMYLYPATVADPYLGVSDADETSL